jgi:hypothetical protein
MAKVALSKSKYKNGYFIPTNPDKYVGDIKNIIYRSSWEKIVCRWFDTNSAIICWNSESLVIDYLYTVDNKVHRYHIDFMAKIKSRDGTIKTYVIEVKPHAERNPPTTKNKRRLLLETQTYIKNQCKWKAADDFCKSKGIEFIVLDEFDLGIKKRK